MISQKKMAENKTEDSDTIDSDDFEDEEESDVESIVSDVDIVSKEEQEIQNKMDKAHLMDWRKCKQICKRMKSLVEVSNFRVPKHKQLLLKVLDEIKITDFI